MAGKPPTNQQSQEARNALILKYYPMVRRVAYRMARRLPRCVDAEDLVNIGVVGLMDAVDRFEGDQALTFGAYARIRVQGAIVDEMRKNDWVPRSVRDRAQRIRRSRESLTESLGRDPTHTELAADLEVSEERLLELIATADVRVLVSTEEGGDDEGTVSDTLAHPGMELDEIVARSDVNGQIREVLKALPEREQAIVEMYYYRDMTFREIADLLGVTESRVSQLHTLLKRRIKDQLERFH